MTKGFILISFLCIQSVDVMDPLGISHWSKASSSYLLLLASLMLGWSKWQHSQAAPCNQCNGTELFKSTQRPANLGHQSFPKRWKWMGNTGVCTAAVLCPLLMFHLQMLMCITRLLFSLFGDIGCSQFSQPFCGFFLPLSIREDCSLLPCQKGSLLTVWSVYSKKDHLST